MLGRVEIRAAVSDLIGLVISAGLAGLWFKTKHFLLNNVFGIALSVKVNSLSLLPSFLPS